MPPATRKVQILLAPRQVVEYVNSTAPPLKSCLPDVDQGWPPSHQGCSFVGFNLMADCFPTFFSHRHLLRFTRLNRQEFHDYLQKSQFTVHDDSGQCVGVPAVSFAQNPPPGAIFDLSTVRARRYLRAPTRLTPQALLQIIHRNMFRLPSVRRPHISPLIMPVSPAQVAPRTICLQTPASNPIRRPTWRRTFRWDGDGSFSPWTRPPSALWLPLRLRMDAVRVDRLPGPISGVMVPCKGMTVFSRT